MKLGIVGYGKMGRMVEALAGASGFEVCAIADPAVGPIDERFEAADVVIEFTEPGVALQNLAALAALGKPVVMGTTGWFEQLAEAQAIAKNAQIGFVYGANFSIGVALFRQIVAQAADRFQSFPEYQPFAFERHHAMKKDAPSGTLNMLVETMHQAGFDRPIEVSSSRAGFVPGTHEIGFDSLADTITLSHVARSREGFARGALHAAKWVIGKRGFFEFSDTLKT